MPLISRISTDCEEHLIRADFSFLFFSFLFCFFFFCCCCYCVHWLGRSCQLPRRLSLGSAGRQSQEGTGRERNEICINRVGGEIMERIPVIIKPPELAVCFLPHSQMDNIKELKNLQSETTNCSVAVALLLLDMWEFCLVVSSSFFPYWFCSPLYLILFTCVLTPFCGLSS